MDSLREIARFVGMEHTGDMRGVPNFVPTLNGGERTSMRAMIRALLGLPPISLQAEATNTSGPVPLLATVTVHPSAGVIQSTTVIVTQGGRVVGGPSALPNQLESSSFDAVTPGQYIINVSRVGVPGTGIATLQKNFSVNALPHPVPPPSPVPPTINVTRSGSGQGSVFTVSGFGFLSNSNVRIRIVDDAFHDISFDKGSDNQPIKTNGEGRLAARIQLPCNSGLGLHFSATDGRAVPDQQDHTGVLFSNTFNTSCP
jgi:hypothetical protein